MYRLALCVWLAATTALTSAAFAFDNGQYDNVPPDIRAWFKSVMAPNGVPCCDISDGHRTEYDVRNGTYWVPIEGQWMAVPERAVIRCRQRPSDYLGKLRVDTMGFWAPHVREAVEVFGAERVMFGTDYGPVPIDPKEHIDIVNALAISPADKEKILWRNAARFYNLDVAP